MVRLTTLGSTDLRLDARNSAEAILRQPRRFALLVYLALEGRRGYVRRDRVLGVFWPESPQAAARTSLSQALHFFRHHLGAETIELRGQEELRLSPARVWTDACAFLDASAAGQAEDALRLIAGDFLPGFYSGGLRDFDDWAEVIRCDLRTAAAEAGWNAAEAAARRGELVAAGAYARRAAAANPGDEAALRRLMELQSRIGDTSGALEAYTAYAERLRREYDAAPAEITRHLAEALRARSAEPVSVLPAVTDGPAAAGPADADVVPSVSNATVMTGRNASFPPERWALARLGAILSVSVVLTASSALWLLKRNPAAPIDFDQAQLRLEAVTGARGSLLTAAIIAHLREAERIDLIAPGGSSNPAASVPQFSLRTTLLVEDKILRATSLLLDPRHQLVLATVSPVDTTESMGVALDRIGRRIAEFARQAVGAELDRRRADLAGLPTMALKTWLAVQREIAAADSLVTRGQHPAAQIRLAAADSVLARLEQAAPRLAVLPRERAALGYRLSSTYRVQPPPGPARARAALAQAIIHANRALALDSTDARTREWRGALGYWWWLTTPTDSARIVQPVFALAEEDLAEAARHLPGAARAWALLSAIYQHSGEFGRAYVAARNALAADAFLQQTRSVSARLFATALEVNDLAGADHWCDQIARAEPHSWLTAYCAITLMAWTGAQDPASVTHAKTLRDRAREDPLLGEARFQVDGAYGVVLAHAGRTREAREFARGLEAESSHEAMPEAAWVSLAIGDTASARRLLTRFGEGDPTGRSWILLSRRFKGLLPSATVLARGP